MSAIQVKNVPQDLHARLRQRAASQGRSVSSYVLDTLERDLALPSMREWLDNLKRDPVTDIGSEEIVGAIQEARDERDEQLERAFFDRR